MAERELTRQKETEARTKSHYDTLLEEWAVLRERARSGRVVVRGKETPWRQSRQALGKQFFYPTIHDTAVRDWMFFVQDIRTHSGCHRHQGGLAIYVIEGKGWTVIDGERYDWEAGDLILLPVRPSGVVHQHFNAEPGTSCKWLGMIFRPFMDFTGNQMEQIQAHPNYAEG